MISSRCRRLYTLTAVEIHDELGDAHQLYISVGPGITMQRSPLQELNRPQANVDNLVDKQPAAAGRPGQTGQPSINVRQV